MAAQMQDDTGPLTQGLVNLQEKVGKLEEISRDVFENKLNKIQDELCLSQDKFNISISNLVRSLNDELTQLNEKVLDIRESLKLQIDSDLNQKEELSVIVERFNDIWTSAGLTIDKLGDQVSVTEQSTNKLEGTVKSFFETSEDTNLIITNLLKKAADIDSNLNKVDSEIQNQIESLYINLNTESQKIQDTVNIGNKKINEGLIFEVREFGDKLTSIVEGDINFIRSDILEFRDKQEKVLDQNVCNQESIQNSLSNLHFTLTDSKEYLTKRINGLAQNLSKLNSASADNLFTAEIMKESLMQLAGWVDGAENILTETNNCVKDIRKNTDIRQVLAELAGLRDAISKNPFKNILSIIEGKITDELLNTRNEIKTSINVIKKKQECDFENINTNISGISQEVFNISQSFTSFENKLRQDFKVLGQVIAEKTAPQNTEDLSGAKIETSLGKLKQDINVELRRINDRFNNLNANIETIDEKLTRLEMKQVVSGDNQNIKQLLESISSQIASQNESGKGNALLLKKITQLEKRMADFDISMKKVVEFIEAE